MTELEELKKKKFPYKITKTNWIVFAVACSISVLLRLITFDDVPEFIGNAVGIGIGYLFFASLFGVVFWFLLGRKENGGSTTFNVLIVIMLLGQFGEFSRNLKKNDIDTTEWNKAISKYKEDIKNDSIPADVAFQTFAASLEKNIDIFIEQSSGDQKELFIGLKEFINEAKQEGNNWTAAQSKIASESFFNFSLLNNEDEINKQIQTAEEFIVASKRYKQFFQSRLAKLEAIIKDKEIEGDLSKDVLEGVKLKVKKQNPVFIPYINYNIEYGIKMKEVLVLIKNNNWKLTKEEYIEFKDATIDEQFNNLIMELTEIEEKVNELHALSVDVM